MIALNRVLIGGKISHINVNSDEDKKTVCTFEIAIKDYYDDTTDFIPCFARGNLAKNIEKYITEDVEVMVEGKIREDEEGALFIYASSVVFVEPTGGKNNFQDDGDKE